MKKIISFLLLISFAFSFPSCKKNTGDENTDNESNNNDNVQSGEDVPSDTPTIVVPEYKDYGRGGVDFKDLTYSRPDLEAVIGAFCAVKDTVIANEVSVTEQINAIKDLEDAYVHAESMYALAEIYAKKDSSVEFWQNEFKYISTNYPLFAQSVEDLLEACALSEHKEAFESDYFGYSLSSYAEGEIYTDELVALLADEAEKEAEYASLSTATVEITYKSVGGFTFEGTVDEIYKMAEEKFGKDTTEYRNATLAIDELYDEKVLALTVPIYVDLLKTRRLIADELGYDSYVEFAYKSIGYQYVEDDMNVLLESIGKYVAPVAEELNAVAFSSYFQKNLQPSVDSVTLINNVYTAYSRMGGEIFDAYSYMLQHGHFDVSQKADGRYDGAFTVYVQSNNSPYVFMTSSGFVKDYTALAHEIGHFYDFFANGSSSASVDLAEVSSQGLELLTLLRLRNELKLSDYEYLEYLTMYNTLNTVILSQSFLAAFEHLAYKLEYDEISANGLKAAAEDAFSLIYGRELTSSDSLLGYLLTSDTVLSPCCAEASVVSVFPALEIFFMESYRTGNYGDGMAVYQELVKRENPGLSFEESLGSVGLSSPFEAETVKKISNSVYYQISGKDYYKDADTDIDAA